jgi:hypothetical protein
MPATRHDERADLPREPAKRQAHEALTQAEHDEWVCRKVAAARADKRLGVSTEQIRQQLQARLR